MKTASCALLLVLILLAFSTAAYSMELSGGFTFIDQRASDDRMKRNATASVDVGMSWPTTRGRWWVYVEGNTTPKIDGIATRLPESNADAGSALDKDREGRTQLSELNYRLMLTESSGLTIGLLDPSGYIDASRITNDENTQFIGVSFVNNPTIDFPDYTLGVVYERAPMDGNPQVRLVLTSSDGIADNPNASYSQLLDVDNREKGVFVAAGLGWERQQHLVRLGLWRHTAPHERLDGEPGEEQNYGAYLVNGYRFGGNAVNLRFGVANREVSMASMYAAAAYQRRFKPWVLGLGTAWIKLSDDAPQLGQDDTLQAETYLRFELRPGLFITGSVQYLKNSAFDASGTSHDSEIYVGSVRFSYVLG